MTARHALTALATTTLIALTACSSNSADKNAGGSTETALRAAVQDNVDAINAGDVQTFLEQQSERCRRQLSEEEAQQTLALINSLYGDITLQTLDILEFNGDSAIVNGTTGIQPLDEADDGTEGARWVYEEGAWRADDCVGTSSPDEGDTASEDPAGQVDTDLAFGDTHNWTDGAALTVHSATTVPADQLSDRDYYTEGTTPFTITITITNNGDEPIDLSEFHLSVDGATTGGVAEPAYINSGDSDILEGRLAPGQSREETKYLALNLDEYGSDITVEGVRFYEGIDLDAPVWAGAIT